MPAVELPFTFSRTVAPRLLVSVRNPAEAFSAISGGCDILDIKEPLRGSLGMADPDVSARILETIRVSHPIVPVSAALGEVVDWHDLRNGDLNLSASKMPTVSGQTLPQCCDLLKLGCSGLRSRSNWRQDWNDTRTAISNTLPAKPGWVAVAYADSEMAEAPCVADIAQAAVQDNCRGLLIDTFTKSERWLLDWMTTDELCSIADLVHSRGLFLALAGSLTAANLSRLRSVPADVFAIRGAACVQGQRVSQISEQAVRDFKQQMLYSSNS